jgi:DNA-binding CsgD family transcriptional regulator
MGHPIDTLLEAWASSEAEAGVHWIGIVQVEGAVRVGEVRGRSPGPCAPGAPVGALGAAWTHRSRWGGARPVLLGPQLPHALRVARRGILEGVLLAGPKVARRAFAERAKLESLIAARPCPRELAVWVVDEAGRPLHAPVGDDGWLAAAVPELQDALGSPGPRELHAGGAHVRILELAGCPRRRAVLRIPVDPVPLSPLLGITETQRRIASFVAVGARNGEIAAAIGRSAETVRTHLAAIYDRLGIGSRVELARLCSRDAFWLESA